MSDYMRIGNKMSRRDRRPGPSIGSIRFLSLNPEGGFGRIASKEIIFGCRLKLSEGDRSGEVLLGGEETEAIVPVTRTRPRRTLAVATFAILESDRIASRSPTILSERGDRDREDCDGREGKDRESEKSGIW
jgi:hypothetical protein